MSAQEEKQTEDERKEAEGLQVESKPLPVWLQRRVTELDASLHKPEHQGDDEYFIGRITKEREIIGKLLTLLTRYGLQLPENATDLCDALALIAPLREDTAQALVGGSTAKATATDKRPRIVSEASQFFKTLETGGMAEKFVRMQAEIPITSHVEVRCKDLSYVVQRTAGTITNPTVGDKCSQFWRGLLCLVPKVAAVATGHTEPKLRKAVLDNVSAVFRPGEITVVLGPPGSGKSALLRLIAGRLRNNKNHAISGDLLYNGLPATNDAFVLPKVVQVVDERDEHVPTLTVEETLTFAFECMDGGRHGAWIPEDQRTPAQKETLDWMDKHNAKVMLVMRSLGLFNAKDTIVGGTGLRGVSGGERRRVTSAEMIVGSHDVGLFDSISTGLDSSTTYDITATLREAARTFKKTIVIALLQPPPEVFDLFDNLCLLAGGHVIYFGKVEGALPYFAALGYVCPARKDAADFLVEVPTDQGVAYLTHGGDIEAGGKPPRSPAEFAERWKATEEARAIEAELAVPFGGGDGGAPYVWPPNQTQKYAGTWMYHFKLCFRKHSTVFMRDSGYIRQRIMTCLIMGLVIGSIFFGLNLEEVNAMMGVIFFAQLFLALASIVAIPQAIEYRAIIYKQTDAAFYSASADTFAQICVAGTLQTVEAIIFAPIIYFMVGLSTANGGSRFFAFMAILVVINLNLAAFFRALAAIFPDFSKAQSFGGISIVFLVLFCGFLVPETDIPDVWIWVFWLNPMAWSFRGAVLNQFLAPEYPKELSSAFLDSYGFRTSPNYIWGAIIFIFVQFLLVSFINIMALTYIRYDVADSKVITPELPPATDEEAMAREKAIQELSSAAIPSVDFEMDSGADIRGSTLVARQLSKTEVVTDLQKAQAAVPATPVTLSFHDVWYSVPHPSGEGELDLLKGVSGFCEPGKMTALMGSSGAGKTTLLDVLAGRKTGGTIKGDILLNGHPKESDSFTRVAGYVEQVDVHSPAVTVREAVAFSAELRLPNELWDAAKKSAFVDSVLKMLELDIIADEIVGLEGGGGLSIEQRKRLTIGVEMAASPSLLFLDEPTSGLDARAAMVVMNAIRRVAATGRTVICTIHQPSTFLFEMFDALLLLKKGGETVYFGELGACSVKLVDYLLQVPGTTPIRANVNPATWMLEQIGAGTSSKASPQLYSEFYKSSLLREANEKKLEEQAAMAEKSEPLKFDSKYAAPLSVQRNACLKRALVQYWRSANYNFTRLAITVVVALVFASNFVNTEVTTESQLASRLGVLYMVTTFMGVVMYQQSIPFFANERPVFYREQACNMYSFQAYAFGYGVAELPYAIASCVLFSIIFYFMSGFDATAAKFGWFLMFFGGFVIFMSFLGHFSSAAMPSVKIAQTMGGVINSIFSLFAGFLISPAKIPSFWIWAFWLNPAHYAIEGLCLTQYHDITDPIMTLTGEVATNVFVIDFFGGKYKYENRFYDMMALFLFIIAARVGYFLAIKHLRYEKR